MISHSQIEAWLKKYKIKGYVINTDGTVDVEGDVDLSNTNIASFPFQFGKVGGGFYCSYTKITSLQGAPQSVGGGFHCHNTKITSLQGAPQSVGGGFYCRNTEITSLQGAPQSVGGDFLCYHTKITSLQGAPQSVGGDFYCSSTRITSLSGVDKIIKRMNGKFVTDLHVTHVLGLVLIPGITAVDINHNINPIINKYVGTGDILSCQDELIDAGFMEQARL